MCLLRKVIYDFKQSSQAWFEKFSRVVADSGFQICAVDHSVYYRKIIKGCVLLAAYVDDILLTGSGSMVIL